VGSNDPRLGGAGLGQSWRSLRSRPETQETNVSHRAGSVDRRYLVPGGGANASNTGCVSPHSSDSPSFGRALRDRPIRQAPGCACPTFRRSCLASAQNSSRVSLAASSPRPRHPPASVITTCTCSCNTATLGQTVIQYRRLNVATVPNAESSTNENKLLSCPPPSPVSTVPSPPSTPSQHCPDNSVHCET
jgi:hypothetical protein